MKHRINSVLITMRLIALGLAACTNSSKQNPLCCSYLQPYSDNSYVWGTVCGFTEPASTPIGSFCSQLASCPAPTQALCCENVFDCLSGTAGPVGINCVVDSS
ncbi:hypothetical protein HYDPIDRAFT_106481 [Hydnomerulius pinastri MD-312]|nr:hypothetical protein HYDPIDRAFT_106481 [Hydnomerulius pinastri MD-312]